MIYFFCTISKRYLLVAISANSTVFPYSVLIDVDVWPVAHVSGFTEAEIELPEVVNT